MLDTEEVTQILKDESHLPVFHQSFHGILACGE